VSAHDNDDARMNGLAVFCADIGSIKQGNFGWARTETGVDEIERHPGGTDIASLVDVVAHDLEAGRPVALGFECPLFVPVPSQATRLGAARSGEANRSWSAGAGAGALTTGIVQVTWILHELRVRVGSRPAFLDWYAFLKSRRGLFLWEAFVTDRAKAATHVDDATIAVSAFRDALPDPTHANAVTAERPLSLVGAALLWSGWSTETTLVHGSCLVIKAIAAPDPDHHVRPAGAGGSDHPVGPRANRDPREIHRKLALLDQPHVAPLTDFVRRLSAHGWAVPWFDPTEAGTEARILMLFENPGRRADAARGSGFISADNDDKTADNMWRFLEEAGVDRRRDVVAWNIVPWYLGDDHKIGEVRTRDIDEARPALAELLMLLPNLRVVILFGRKAQTGWRRARTTLDIPVIEAPHPSGRWLNGHPEDRPVILDALREALRIADSAARAPFT
jgi:uracil-DNA glycosylase